MAKTTAEEFIVGKNKRVWCTINGGEPFQCAIMQAANEYYFINVNQELRDRYSLSENDIISVSLRKDTSEYGLPFPDELREVFLSDPTANTWFESLSPGKKRNLLYIINKVKSVEKRIEKSLIIAEHLNQYKGKIDFKVLNERFRKPKF